MTLTELLDRVREVAQQNRRGVSVMLNDANMYRDLFDPETALAFVAVALAAVKLDDAIGISHYGYNVKEAYCPEHVELRDVLAALEAQLARKVTT
jgi:hypothetical protein